MCKTLLNAELFRERVSSPPCRQRELPPRVGPARPRPDWPTSRARPGPPCQSQSTSMSTWQSKNQSIINRWKPRINLVYVNFSVVTRVAKTWCKDNIGQWAELQNFHSDPDLNLCFGADREFYFISCFNILELDQVKQGNCSGSGKIILIHVDPDP